jgi:hypothetical protein
LRLLPRACHEIDGDKCESRAIPEKCKMLCKAYIINAPQIRFSTAPNSLEMCDLEHMRQGKADRFEIAFATLLPFS